MRTVVLGGYGNFGARICRALAHSAGIELVVAARNGARAAQFAAELGAQAAAVDAGGGDLAQQLRRLGAELVIHTAGPFQGQDYAVAHAAAAAGCHYIDLADGRRFVCDFAGALDETFRRAGRFAVAGASTVPALSSAVIDALRPRFEHLDSIDICIAPAQQAPRGEATMAGVLSYCGAPIEVWQGGRWQSLHGWADPTPVHFARMASRLGALCEIPDLELLPARYPEVQSVMFCAALEVRLAQRAMAGIGALRRSGLLRHPERHAALLARAGSLFDPWGSALGGMVVRLGGSGADGRPLQLAWHISADHNHGPEIPCMPAILLARRLAGGGALPGGAHPCMGWLGLDDFAPEFARWGMLTEMMAEDAPA